MILFCLYAMHSCVIHVILLIGYAHFLIAVSGF